MGGWARPRQSQRGHLRQAGWLGLCSRLPRPRPRPSPGPMAPRQLSPLVLALGGAAAVLGSVLFILWKTYFGRGRERRWDGGEAWWGAEPARLPEWDEWDVSAWRGPAPPCMQPRGVTTTLRVGGIDAAGLARVGARASQNRETDRRLGVMCGAILSRHKPLSFLAGAGARGRGPGALSSPRPVQRAPARRLRSAQDSGDVGKSDPDPCPRPRSLQPASHSLVSRILWFLWLWDVGIV